MNNAERVVVADLIRPRGNKGELLAVSQTDVPGRLEGLKRAWVTLPGAGEREVELEQVWQHKEFCVLKFAGVDSISAAEQFSGVDLWVPGADRGRLPDGQFFRTDLIGFSVRLAQSGAVIGQVAGWQEFGGPLLMEVAADRGEILIPFVDSICLKVDLDERAVIIDPPEGLLEL